MSKPKSLGQQLDDMQTELNRLKELEKLFDKAVKLEVVSSLIFIFLEEIGLSDIARDIPRHIPTPIPTTLLFKTILQSIAVDIPMLTPLIILSLFISFVLQISSSNRFLYSITASIIPPSVFQIKYP